MTTLIPEQASPAVVYRDGGPVASLTLKKRKEDGQSVWYFKALLGYPGGPYTDKTLAIVGDCSANQLADGLDNLSALLREGT